MEDHVESAAATAYVIVLGDVGRSPRMCNHALSLASAAEGGVRVHLVGYGGSRLKSDLSDCPLVSLHLMSPYPQTLNKHLPKILSYLFKALWQAFTLWFSLPLFLGPDVILMQNPPTIPALIVCYLYCVLHRGTKLVLDWHNYGYSILALALGRDHLLVKVTYFLEGFLGRKVRKAFCVSEAMRKDLRERWGVDAITLYDRALKPSITASNLKEERSHDLFMRLAKDNPEFSGYERGDGVNKTTLFTKKLDDRTVNWRRERPALLVSSTSWTEDEDFSILLDALDYYEAKANSQEKQQIPDLLCVVTGKGPLKEYYRRLINQRCWIHIKVVTPWLEPDDYPKLLACADFGVCLHTSSSGFDLPMKIVDMFGCGLPVLAKKYPAITELVQHGRNGILFDTAAELAGHLIQLFDHHPDQPYLEKRKTFVEHVNTFRDVDWTQHWKEVASLVIIDQQEDVKKLD